MHFVALHGTKLGTGRLHKTTVHPSVVAICLATREELPEIYTEQGISNIHTASVEIVKFTNISAP
jgi:hypothetical protein